MKKIKSILLYLSYFLVFITIPIIINFTYFQTLSENSYPLKHTKYLEEQNYHLFDPNSPLIHESIRNTNDTYKEKIQKWIYYENIKYKNYLFFNISESKTFITVYLMFIMSITYLAHRKKIKNTVTNFLKYATIISSLILIILAFLFSDTKLYYHMKMNYDMSYAIEKSDAPKFFSNRMKNINNNDPKNFNELKEKIENYDQNIVSTLIIQSQMSNVSYIDIGKYIIMDFSTDIIKVSQEIDKNKRENHSYNYLSYYYDILLLINLVFILVLFKTSESSKKNIKFLGNIILTINILTIVYLFNITLGIGINVFNLNNNDPLLSIVKSISETNFNTSVKELKNTINTTYDLKETLFKNQLLFLIFSFLIIQKEVILQLLKSVNNEKFIFIIFTIMFLFLFQSLLISAFNLYILFSIIIYLGFFLRDNITINKLNKMIVFIFALLCFQEIAAFIYESVYLQEIYNNVNNYKNNEIRSNDFAIKQFSNIVKIEDNKYLSSYYSKTFSILLSILFYFVVKNSINLNIEDKNKNKNNKKK